MPALRSLPTLLGICILTTGALRAEDFDLSQVNDDTPMTVGLFSRIADATLPSVVSIRVHAKISEDLRQDLEKLKEYRDRPGDFLGDPEFQRFRERFFQPEFEELEKYFDDPDAIAVGAGAGVIFNEEGHIITNAHVIGGESGRGNLEVRLHDGRVFTGKDVEVIAHATLIDLAVLKIPPGGLTPARFGDSRATRIAEQVLAVGNPLELENTVSNGIISAKGRRIDKATIEDHFQTTAMINPGNSGGPLVNMRGEVIGINVAIATNTDRWQGIGFAVPTHVFYEVVENLIHSGREQFGYLGVTMVEEEMRPDGLNRMKLLRWYGLREGVPLGEVRPGGPAAEAGLRAEDIIVKVDDEAVKDNQDLLRRVAMRPVGDVIELTAMRPGDSGVLEEVQVAVTLGARPSEAEIREEMLKDPRGELLNLRPGPDASKTNGLGIEFEPAEGGLRITRVYPDSPAAKADLRQGDVVKRINQRPAQNAEDYEAAIQALGNHADHLIHIEREGFAFVKLAPAG